MIRIQKLQSTTYYQDMEKQYNAKNDYEDYLTKSEHVPAEFVGGLFKGLEYNAEAYNAISKGQDPTTYESLTRSDTKNAGYDIVVAMPKSYSMLYATADKELREKLNEIHRETIHDYLKDVTTSIRPANNKAEYQCYDPEQTKTISAVFNHIENRDLEPHIHTHINLFNSAEFTMNGEKKTLAINAQELYYRQKEMNAEFNNRLCDRLNEIGIQTIGTKDGFRVVGVTAEQEQMFSVRRNEILDFIEDQKNLGKHYSSRVEAEIAEEKIRNQTKEQKPNLNSREILDYQKNQLAEKGITLESIMSHQKEYEYVQPEIIEQSIIRDSTALAGVVSETELKRQIFDINRDLPKSERINFKDFCRRNELIEVDLDNKHKGFTTNEIIITEMQNIERAKALAHGDYGKLELKINAKDIKNETLEKLQKDIIQKTDGKGKMNEGQIDSCKLIAKNERICLIEGDAGTGKTTTAIQFANDYYTAQGYEVIGLATQGKTSQSLQDAGIENTQNLSQFFVKEPSGGQRVLIVDEAGMTGAEHYGQLLKYAEKNPNTKIVLVGDQKQLASVAYGTTFENIRDNLGENHQRRLWENMRQKTDEQKAIAESARDRNPEKMLETLKETGGLHETRNREGAIKQLAQDYATSDKTKVALAHTNVDVNSINDAIRQELSAKGKLNMENQKEFTINTGKTQETRSFSENDQIILTGKHNKKSIEIVDVKGQALEVKRKVVIENGTEASIKKIEGNKVTITTKEDGKTYTLDTNNFNKFNHAYCVTTHKSQGMTVQESYVYANGNENANRNYVNMSRHKDQANLYIATENKERYIQNAALNENKVNLTKDINCQERYAEIKENRQSLLADPYNTKNQIKDLQEQIGKGQQNPDIKQRLDQMHRLDSILKDLQQQQDKVLEQKTAYDQWKAEKQAERGNWKNKKPTKETAYEKDIKQKEKVVETQIQTAQEIKNKLKEDIAKMQEQKLGPKTDKTREEILAELKTKTQKQVEPKVSTIENSIGQTNEKDSPKKTRSKEEVLAQMREEQKNKKSPTVQEPQQQKDKGQSYTR